MPKKYKNRLFITRQVPCRLPSGRLAELLDYVCQEEGRNDVCEVQLTIVDDEKMQQLNTQYRGKNKVTDVLSFETGIPGIPMLGDIVIDISQAVRQKRTDSVHEELIILFLHGLLHLLGYDHIRTDDRLIMQGKENLYLTKWKEF